MASGTSDVSFAAQVRFACLIAYILFACFGGGCATLTLTTVGTIVGSVAAPAQSIFDAGKAHSAEMTDFQSAIAAANDAANDLGMQIEPGNKSRDPKDLSKVELWFVDDKRNRLVVKAERRARNLVIINVSVGFFGSEPVAHLFLDRLKSHLARSQPPPRDVLRNPA